jgi:hypothetical protein
MLTFLFLWSFHNGCPDTEVRLRCFCQWVDRDQAALERNRDFCANHYEKNICMKSFTKLEEGTYYISCDKK